MGAQGWGWGWAGAMWVGPGQGGAGPGQCGPGWAGAMWAGLGIVGRGEVSEVSAHLAVVRVDLVVGLRRDARVGRHGREALHDRVEVEVPAAVGPVPQALRIWQRDLNMASRLHVFAQLRTSSKTCSSAALKTEAQLSWKFCGMANCAPTEPKTPLGGIGAY